jgi:hypothetical protein
MLDLPFINKKVLRDWRRKAEGSTFFPLINKRETNPLCHLNGLSFAFQVAAKMIATIY